MSAGRFAARAPRVLAIAGFEPTGRVGLMADLEAVRMAGGVPCGVATALTAQGARTFAVHPIPAAVIRRQIEAVLEGAPIGAAKIGMISNRAALASALAALDGLRGCCVIDPVTRTSAGERLSWLRPKDYLERAAASIVLTPNAVEAAWLLGEPAPPQNPEEAARLGERLLRYGFAAVIVKGGHLKGRAVDVLCTPAGVKRLDSPRLPRAAQARGSGCRFASTLATALARGYRLGDAADEAKALVRTYLESH
jgi:hydroxymethylpyrimidine/phosphomethylpyrimidine kinase